MNQTEATERVASALDKVCCHGIDHVGILTPVPDLEPSVILVRTSDGAHLSVTVEILAQP